MTSFKIELSNLEFQNKPRSVLKVTWFLNSYKHDAMFVYVLNRKKKSKVE